MFDSIAMDYENFYGIEDDTEYEFRMNREIEEEFEIDRAVENEAVRRLIDIFKNENNRVSAAHFEMKISEASD